MPSSYTQNTGIELIANGEQSTTWGTTTNTNFDIIDRAISGVGSIALSGTTSTLSTVDGDETSDGLNRVLVLGGTPSGPHTITVSPNNSQKLYIVQNDSGETVTFTQGSGGNVSIATGTSKIIFCDGAGAAAEVTDVTGSLSFNDITITGGSISGVTLSTANATITGGTITGTSFTTSNATITGGSITGITDLAIADGGTGASTAAGARTNLGVAIGSDVLAYDANLQSFVTTFTLPTTDGAAGQVLSTNGSGTLGFEDQRVAGSTLFTADGAVSAGDVVVLNSDGTVSTVTQSDAPAAVGAANYDLPSANTTIPRLIYNSSGTEVVAFLGQADGLRAAVGTVSGTSISWGASQLVVPFNSTITVSDVCLDTSRNTFHVLVANFTYSISLVNGTFSLNKAGQSFPASFVANGIQYSAGVNVWKNGLLGTFGFLPALSITYDAVNDKFIMSLPATHSSSAPDSAGQVFFLYGTPDGSDGITWSANVSNFFFAVALSFNTRRGVSDLVHNPDTNEFGQIFTADIPNAGIHLLQLSANTLTASVDLRTVFVGGSSTGNTAGLENMNLVYDLSAQRYVSRRGERIFLTPAGEGGGTVAQTSPLNGKRSRLRYDPTSDRVYFFTTNDNITGRLYVGVYNGSTYNFANAVPLTSLAMVTDNVIDAVVDETNDKLVYFVSDVNNNANFFRSSVVTPPVITTSAGDWVGVSEESIADNAEGFVTVLGGINDQQSGLTIGQTYFVSSTGSLSATTTAFGKIGKAISATELLVTEGNA